ncbi:MAG: hypothetical protein P0S95_00325 [Rhabdochlamydiaceae bacterium]|nr:hypothetical protein [Candidatus Amphrikana amoebophyrae]
MATQPIWDESQEFVIPTNLKSLIIAFTKIFDKEASTSHPKLAGALQVLIAFAPMDKQYEDILFKLEDALEEHLKDPNKSTTSQVKFLLGALANNCTPKKASMKNLTHNMIVNSFIPIVESLPEDKENEMAQVVIGMVAMMQYLSFSPDMSHALKALEYDASLYEMFPSTNTKGAIYSQASEMVHDYF